jgi:hypothetical protein
MRSLDGLPTGLRLQTRRRLAHLVQVAGHAKVPFRGDFFEQVCAVDHSPRITYRAHVGRMRETGSSGMSLGGFLHDLADMLDADSAAGQLEIITAAEDYLKGARRGVRLGVQRLKRKG